MKRNLLAIAIPALLLAGTASASIEVWNKDGNKLDIYGRVYALNYIGDRDNKVDGEGDSSTVRLGFSGQTQVTDWLSGYGRAEWEHDAGGNDDNGNDSTSTSSRYAFAGLNFGQYGSFDYGRNDGVLKTLTSYTDVLPEFGGDAANNSFYALSSRTKAVATYRNSDFFGLADGLRFALQYADNGDNAYDNGWDKRGYFENNDNEAYGVVVDWDILDTGLTVGAGYAATGGDKDLKSWSAGIKYDNNNIYLAALYIQGKRSDGYDGNNIYTNLGANRYEDLKTQGIELVAQYGIDFEVGRLTPSLAYVQHKAKDASDYNANVGGDYLKKYVEIGLTYDFNKNLQGIIDYKINLLDKDDAGPMLKGVNKDEFKGSTKDTVALGLIYQF